MDNNSATHIQGLEVHIDRCYENFVKDRIWKFSLNQTFGSVPFLCPGMTRTLDQPGSLNCSCLVCLFDRYIECTAEDTQYLPGTEQCGGNSV